MKIYEVGGCVRDRIMDLMPNDIDYVVVGSTPSEMLSLGYKQVGKDFPVFLHPKTGDEYALARRERKIGAGYTGFEFDIDGITIEDDLSRRDLTINAIAFDPITCEFIDPFDGRKDIEAKVLRAVDLGAFVEDPVRVLRAARFMARYGSEWQFDHDTYEAMRAVTQSGDWAVLTPERVWKELEKVLTEKYPEEFFKALVHFKETVWFPEIWAMAGVEQPAGWHPEGDVFVHTMQALSVAARDGFDPIVRFAALCHDFGKPITYAEFGEFHGHEAAGLPPVAAFCARLKVPTEFRKLALIVTEQHLRLHRITDIRPGTVIKIFESMRAWQNPEMVDLFAQACEADARARNNFEDKYPQRELLQGMLKVATEGVKEHTQELIEKETKPQNFGGCILQFRISNVRRFLKGIE